jgi:two-component system chemotaxis response regulator CheB
MPDEKYEIENRIALEDNALQVGVRKLGPSTFYTCPECQGSLVAIEEGRIKRYRCHTGHAYSQRSLYSCGLEQIEQSLWSTLAHLEEEQVLLADMAKEALDAGETDAAESHRNRIEVVKALIEELRGVALSPLFSDTE